MHRSMGMCAYKEELRSDTFVDTFVDDEVRPFPLLMEHFQLIWHISHLCVR